MSKNNYILTVRIFKEMNICYIKYIIILYDFHKVAYSRVDLKILMTTQFSTNPTNRKSPTHRWRKMAAEVRWLPLVAGLILVFVSENEGMVPHRRFEYKYSFKPPYLAQKDGSVPFWEYGGSK